VIARRLPVVQFPRKESLAGIMLLFVVLVS
jgi:hypothetical protein